LAQPASQRHLERLHEYVPHVAAHPLIKDSDEEAAELFGPDRPLGDKPAALRIQRPVRIGPLAPVQVG
jgi:hypothetical protein